MLGPQAQTFIRDAWDFTAGVSGRSAGDWSWNADYVFGVFYRDDIHSGAPSGEKIVARNVSGADNPFALDSAKGVNPNNNVAFDNPKALAERLPAARRTMKRPRAAFRPVPTARSSRSRRVR